MNKIFKNKIFLIITVFSAVIAIYAIASEADVQYPVAELGNCENKGACKLYCDEPKNGEACLAFAQKYELLSKEEINVAEQFLEGETGPGGCATKEACETYCNDISHIDVCIAFAEKNNIMPPDELAEAKKVQAAIQKGVKPPPCGNKRSCDAYCENPEHMEECISFAKDAGILEGKEAEDADKMLMAVKRGVKPPPCAGKDACDAFCTEPANMEVCMNFAIEAGMMDEGEKADAQKMLQAIKNGAVPPKCKGKEECDAYCATDEHFEECMNFALAAGMMDPKDAEMARKTKGKGPGNCKGKEECEAFCNDPANQETCFNFAKENGLISEEELKKMEEGTRQMKDMLSQAPQTVIDCLNSALGADMVEKLKNGTAMPSREMGDKMGTCFQQMGGPGGPNMGAPCTSPEECKAFCDQNPDKCQNGEPIFQPGGPGMPPGGPGPGQSGPGGCTTPEECQAYCNEHPQECQGGPGPGEPRMPPQPPKQTGPGGCDSPEACEAYCQAHPQECGAPPPNIQPPTGQMPPDGFMPPEGYQPPANFQPPEGYQPPTGQMPPDGFMPPEGYQPPANFQPPEGYQPPTGQMPPADFQPPIEQQQFQPPPPAETLSPPTSKLTVFFANIWSAFTNLLFAK